MLTRIQPRHVLDLARRDVPAPVDVVNLITPSHSFEPYRWYGVLVLPAMLAAGARVLWMGSHEHTIGGERQAAKVLLVRYPSHRRFLAMTLNPYYLAINLLREAGVSRFEAAFTLATNSEPGLERRRRLVGVHYNSPPAAPALEVVTRELDKTGHELVYATRMTAPIDILEPPRPSDPNPLSLPELALFAPRDEATAPAQALAPLRQATDGLAMHAYERESRRAYRPELPPVLREAF